MLPLQVVVVAVTEIAHDIAAFGSLLCVVDGSDAFYIVAQLLITAQPCCLGLISGALQTLLTLHTVYLRAVSRHGDGNDALSVQIVDLLKAVVKIGRASV
jgi:hypothetical protein